MNHSTYMEVTVIIFACLKGTVAHGLTVRFMEKMENGHVKLKFG